MTGRGNHVLCAEYKTDVLYTTYCFYELGDQLDDKIDMFYLDGPLNGPGEVDTITANNEGLHDVIIGEGGRYDFSDVKKVNGSIQILYGTRDIPTRTMAVASSKAGGGDELRIYPNPVHGRFVTVSFDSHEARAITASIYDVQGALMLRQQVTVGEGDQSVPIRIPALPNGSYQIRLTGRDFFLGSFFQISAIL